MKKKSSEYKAGETYQLNVDQLKSNPEQPRKYFDQKSIDALAESIKEDKLLQNILFTSHEGELLIVSGERRCRAIKLLKDQGHEVILTGKYVEGSLRKLAFVENLFREDMTAIEYAEGALALQNAGEQLSQGALGKLLGLKRTTVNGILSIANMPESLKDKVRDNPRVSRDRLEKISRIKGEIRQEKAINALLAELEEKQVEAPAGDSVPKDRTRGEIVAGSLTKFTERVKLFSTEEYALRLSPDDRNLLATKLGEVKEQIQATLDAMSERKAEWDKAHEEKKAKVKKKNASSKKKDAGKTAKTKNKK